MSFSDFLNSFRNAVGRRNAGQALSRLDPVLDDLDSRLAVVETTGGGSGGGSGGSSGGDRYVPEDILVRTIALGTPMPFDMLASIRWTASEADMATAVEEGLVFEVKGYDTTYLMENYDRLIASLTDEDVASKYAQYYVWDGDVDLIITFPQDGLSLYWYDDTKSVHITKVTMKPNSYIKLVDSRVVETINTSIKTIPNTSYGTGHRYGTTYSLGFYKEAHPNVYLEIDSDDAQLFNLPRPHQGSYRDGTSLTIVNIGSQALLSGNDTGEITINGVTSSSYSIAAGTKATFAFQPSGVIRHTGVGGSIEFSQTREGTWIPVSADGLTLTELP